MDYKINQGSTIQEANWDEKTCIRRQGGYSIDASGLPSDLTYLPKGAVLAITSDDKVQLVKTAVAAAEAKTAATSLKVEKGHLLKVGDSVAGSVISAINTSNAGYDTLTVAALTADVAKSEVVADANVDNIIGLNYATVKIDSFPTCTVTVQAYEIEEDTLPYPVNDAIKAALTSRHAWKV